MKDFDYLLDICDVSQNVPSPSTFGSGGRLACVAYPKSGEELALVIRELKNNGEEYYVLGGCSNVLISDNGVDKAVISTRNLKGRKLSGENIYLGAGEKICDVCKFAADNSLSGIEGLCSIPGSVGGGIAMNCGAFGREIADVVGYVDILIDGRIERASAADMDFGYRRSNAKETGAVVGVGITLAKGDKRTIAMDMKGYKIARSISQPKGKSLGSVFKKAEEISAGYYIDRAGLKGLKVGGAQISYTHANFIINAGGATSNDFLSLAEYARKEVDKTYGIKLEYEVEFL